MFETKALQEFDPLQWIELTDDHIFWLMADRPIPFIDHLWRLFFWSGGHAVPFRWSSCQDPSGQETSVAQGMLYSMGSTIFNTFVLRSALFPTQQVATYWKRFFLNLLKINFVFTLYANRVFSTTLTKETLRDCLDILPMKSSLILQSKTAGLSE